MLHSGHGTANAVMTFQASVAACWVQQKARGTDSQLGISKCPMGPYSSLLKYWLLMDSRGGVCLHHLCSSKHLSKRSSRFNLYMVY